MIADTKKPCKVIVYRTWSKRTWKQEAKEPDWCHLVSFLTHSFGQMDLFPQTVSLLFNMLPMFVIAFLPVSKHHLISWLQSPSTVILEPKKIKSATVSIFSPPIFHEVMGPDVMTLVIWMLNFEPAFTVSSFTLIKRINSSSLSATGVASLHIWVYWYFPWKSWFQLVFHLAWHFTWCTLHIS